MPCVPREDPAKVLRVSVQVPGNPSAFGGCAHEQATERLGSFPVAHRDGWGTAHLIFGFTPT